MPRLRAEVGYDPEHAAMLPVPEGRQRPHPIATGRGRGAVERLYVRCVNFATPAVCNWLVPLATNGDGAGPLLCRSCRLTRTVPDLADPVHGTW